MKTSHRVFAAAVAACFLAGSASAQIFVLLNRTHEFQQTGASTTSEFPTNPWMFEAAISGAGLTASYPTGPNQITLPSSGPVYALVDPVTLGDSEWRYRPANFATLGDMTTAFPNGTYTFQFNGNTWSPILGSTSFAGNAPVANIGVTGSWSGNMLTISTADALAGFSISTTWAGGDGFTSGLSRVGIYLDKQSGPDALVTIDGDNGPTFTTNSASINILGGDLKAGNTYKVGLEFNAFLAAPADFETGTFTAVVLNTVTTEFTIQVIPEPSTYAAMLGALALAGAAIHRRRRVRV